MIEVTMRKCFLYGRKGINAVQGVFNRGIDARRLNILD